jgi:uncharacterized zinc-type alcohol dehydrogenase-like protein
MAPKRKATIIALANQKGGVAKTTSVASLGAAFAEQGRRVLLVDLDPQACLTFSLGVDPDTVESSVHDVLVGGVEVADVIVHCEEGIHLVPSTIDLAGAEAVLLSRPAREYVLQSALDAVRRDYDIILLDCSPSLGVLTLNALTAAQGLIIPMPCEMLGHRGVGQLLDTVRDVKRILNKKLKVIGSSRRCSTAASTTRASCSTTSVSGTASPSCHPRSPRPCGSRRPRPWGVPSSRPRARPRAPRPTARSRHPCWQRPEHPPARTGISRVLRTYCADMPTTTPALIADSATSGFRQGTIERRDLRPDDIRIAIAYAGICHSDIHTVREEWGPAHFPLTVGHEIAGTVLEVGAEVTRHSVGDRVGVGCLVDSCGECEPCKDGMEMFCTKPSVGTYNSKGYDGEWTMGGYAQEVVVSERMVLRIPDALELDVAAPLLCAGITTYSPLRRWGAGTGRSVAVVGVGGLGHMGVKIAAAMGATVTTISRSDAKAADAVALGARAHIATSDPDAMRAAKGTFDIVLNTVSADIPIADYVRLLKPNGVVVNVGLPPSPYSISPGSLIGGNKAVAGSSIGGIAETQEMLDFCAEHGIAATIEVVSAADVNEVWDRVVDGDVRYRAVIDTSTITPA